MTNTVIKRATYDLTSAEETEKESLTSP